MGFLRRKLAERLGTARLPKVILNDHHPDAVATLRENAAAFGGSIFEIIEGDFFALKPTVAPEKAAGLGLKPLCTILDYAEVSQPPKDIATAPGLAIRKILEQNDLTLDRIKLVEINEAFAAVVLVSARTILGMTKEQMFAKVNNVFDRRYATAGALAESPFVGGSFQADPDDWRRQTFVAPGAPRAAWVGVRYVFGGK